MFHAAGPGDAGDVRFALVDHDTSQNADNTQQERREEATHVCIVICLLLRMSLAGGNHRYDDISL